MMKKLLLMFICMIMCLTSSCLGFNKEVNKNIAAYGLENAKLERIVITNNRYSGRYTIIDESTISRFTKSILAANAVSENNSLDPDFIFDFYDGEKRVASFKYIAGIDDSNKGNLIDEKGRQYSVTNSIEDEFMKRILKREDYENVPDYYISLIKLLVEKSNVPDKSNIVVDISKDYSVTRSMISVEQESILNSIDDRNVKISFPGEIKNPDFTIKINTDKYYNNTCETTAEVKDKNNDDIKYEIKGTYDGNRWTYYIKYK